MNHVTATRTAKLRFLDARKLGPNDPRQIVITVELCRGEGCAPHKTVHLQPCPRYTELSITAEVWYPGDRHNDPGQCGQCIDTVREHWGAHNPLVTELCEIWERWHLNGMTAGTHAQNEHLRAHPPEPPSYPVGYYEKACATLKEAGLYEDQGYTYGSAWLVEELPQDVIKRLGEICRELGDTPFKLCAKCGDVLLDPQLAPEHAERCEACSDGEF